MAYSVLATTNGPAISRQIRADAAKHPRILSNALSRLAYYGRLDAQDSMKRELDRPKPFTVKAVNYTKSNARTLRSSVFVNKNNTYLPTVVYGGIRQNRGRILVPNRQLRTDRYGNLGRARRRNILSSPKTFVINKGGKKKLYRRTGKRRIQFVASLERSTRYKAGGYWKFHDSALRTHDRRFSRLLTLEHRKLIK